MKKVFIVIFFLLFVCISVYSSEPQIISGADFLLMGIGARAIGMGGAFSAVTGDLDNSYWNPAGIADIKGFSFSAMLMRKMWSLFLHTCINKRIFESRLFNVEFCGTVGANYDISPRTVVFMIIDPDYFEKDENIDAISTDINFGISYGMKIGNLHSGINVRRIIRGDYWGVDMQSPFAMLFDVGMIYEAEFLKFYKNNENNFHLGLVAKNIGNKIEYLKEHTNLPTKVGIGMFYNLYKDEINDFKICSDFLYGIEKSIIASIGAEYVFKDFLSFRVGYQYNSVISEYSMDGISIGFGYKYLDKSNSYPLILNSAVLYRSRYIALYFDNLLYSYSDFVVSVSVGCNFR